MRSLPAALFRLATVTFAVAAAQSTTTTTALTETATATTTTTATPTILTDCNKTAIDSFAQTGLNNLNLNAYDDGTLAGYAVAGGVLSLTPAANDTSYFYETLNCLPLTGGRFIVFTLQTTSTIQFVTQLQPGCGNTTNQRINGPLVIGEFPQATTFAVDTLSFLTLAGATNLWAFVLTHMNTTAGTAPWSISNLLVASTMPCGYTNVTLITQSDVTPNWTNSTSGVSCRRVAVDSFEAYGSNNLGVDASDDHTMNTYTVADGQVTMVPRANGTSYWYEDIAFGGNPFNVAATPYLVFSAQTSASAGSFQLVVEGGPINGVSRFTLATLTPGTTAKNYVVPLASYFTATQLENVISFSWRSFKSDGASPWIFKSVSLVSNYTACDVANPTLVRPASTTTSGVATSTLMQSASSTSGVATPSLVPSGVPSGCNKLSVNAFTLAFWVVAISVLMYSA
ncbi:hypothetical protein BDZ88DRAFT_268423 [Geranomyces variabilis]|nr:hypothetical protein BDZ88DRAFT_268423 [Geranomyces variabilis]KAJ3133192.1 hypothetical protein HDU90_006347 [Geranomyces variabilis]